jgi:hypothetical protein
MPAEAEALARAGLADVQTLLPLVKAEHHVLDLAVLARAERAQGERAVARELLRDIRDAGSHSQTLRAVARIAEAEDLADLEDDEKNREKAFALLEDAAKRWPAYTNWYLTQPKTLSKLRADERLAPLLAAAQSALTTQQETAPKAQTVAIALDIGEKEATARPAKQASRAAIGLQVLTLAATLILLLLWTWRFFVVSG